MLLKNPEGTISVYLIIFSTPSIKPPVWGVPKLLSTEASSLYLPPPPPPPHHHHTHRHRHVVDTCTHRLLIFICIETKQKSNKKAVKINEKGVISEGWWSLYGFITFTHSQTTELLIDSVSSCLICDHLHTRNWYVLRICAQFCSLKTVK